ncbi:MAG: Ig-like domain-containing protein [Chitinophagales bacterium]
MKKTITLFTFILAYSLNYAQLGNPSFENWENPLLSKTINVSGVFATVVYYNLCDNFNYEELENWSSTNQLTTGSKFGNEILVKDTNMAIDGTKALQIESKDISITAKYQILFPPAPCTGTDTTISNVAPGLIVNGSFDLDAETLVEEIIGGSGLNALNPFKYPGVGEAIDFIPKSISGHYIYDGAFNGEQDSCIIISGLKKDGELIGHVIQRLGNASSWTPFTLDYSHINCETPDTIVTVISSSNLALQIINNEFEISDANTGIHGSKLIIDNLHIDTIELADFPPLLASDFDTIFIADTATVPVLNNDLFCDMGTYAPLLETSPTNGTVTINALNEMVYIPDVNFIGNDTFTYYICNANLWCDTTTVTIKVDPVPICEANDDVRTFDTGTTDQFDPRANDVDCGTTLSIITSPANGTAIVESNGFTITYSPDTDFVGADNFDYSICSDANPNQCDTATINYNVQAVNINNIDNDLISINPNPAKNILNVKVDLNERIELTMFNTIGEIVAQEVFENAKTISLANINTGLYFMELKAGNKKSIRKIHVIK